MVGHIRGRLALACVDLKKIAEAASDSLGREAFSSAERAAPSQELGADVSHVIGQSIQSRLTLCQFFENRGAAPYRRAENALSNISNTGHD